MSVYLIQGYSLEKKILRGERSFRFFYHKQKLQNTLYLELTVRQPIGNQLSLPRDLSKAGNVLAVDKPITFPSIV